MSRKNVISLILAIVIMMTSFSTSVFATEDAKVIINGESQSYSLFLTGEVGNYHILAPAEELSAALEASAQWDEENNRVTITKDSTTIIFTIDKATAVVNNKTEELEISAKLVDGEPFVPVEFCGREFGYHTLREIAGKRVRIISKTSTTAPALTQKEGMAELVSEVHRPIPTEFTKSNELSVENLIYAKEDYSDVRDYIVRPNNPVIPDGEVILSQDKFVDMMTGFADDTGNKPNWVDITETDPLAYSGKISMLVKMIGQVIGEGFNLPVSFKRAVRLNVKVENTNNPGNYPIYFYPAVPSPEVRDQYILTFWARLIEGGDPGTGKGSFVIQMQNDEWHKTVNATPEFGTEWKRFDYLLTGYEGADDLRILPALNEQIIEIGGFQITDVGQDADVSYFDKEEDLLWQELSPNATWRAEALERIEEIRKGDFKVIVQDSKGNPVKDAKVTFDMFEHDFKFGVQQDIESVEDEYWDDPDGLPVYNPFDENGMIKTDYIWDYSQWNGYLRTDSNGNYIPFTANEPQKAPEGSNKTDKEYYDPTGKANGSAEKEYRERRGTLFNALSVGNRLKWGSYAYDKLNNPDLPSTANVVIDKAHEDGIKYVRGHALWMPNNSKDDYPRELYELVKSTSPATPANYKKFLGLLEEHFAEMNEAFPEIYEWDVTNETNQRPSFTNKFTSIQPEKDPNYIFKDIYEIAARTLTNGQELMICDNAQFEEQYWDRLDWFKEHNIEYDSLGMQGHSKIGSKDPDNDYRPQKWLEVWDRFAYEYGKTFAVTEFSVGALNDEYGQKGQGDYMRDIMIAAFSHPACTGFNIWWMSDHWSDWNSPFAVNNYTNKEDGAGVSPLYTRQFQEKPGVAIFKDLLYNKWWTKGATAITDAGGMGTINGYYGDYDITVTVNGKQVKTQMAAFHKGYENVLTITLD